MPATGGVVRVDCTAATIAAPIASGALAKVGSGALVLSGSSGYTGETDVAAGALEVNGALAVGGAVLVESGGVLGGSGGVGTIYVVSGGALAPGGLTAAAVDLAAGAAIDYVLGTGNPGGDSLLVVAGAAEFAAGVVVNVTPAAAWGDGMYPLLDLLSVNYPSPVTLVLNWTAVGGGLGGHAYSFVAAGHDIDLNVPVVNGVWSASGGGAWSGGGNWLGGAAPNAVGDTALLGAAVGDNTATITLAAAETLSSLSFSPAAGGSYVLNDGGGAATGRRRRFGERFCDQRRRLDQRPGRAGEQRERDGGQRREPDDFRRDQPGRRQRGVDVFRGRESDAFRQRQLRGRHDDRRRRARRRRRQCVARQRVGDDRQRRAIGFGGRRRHRRTRRLCRRAGIGGTDASPKRRRGRFGRHFPRSALRAGMRLRNKARQPRRRPHPAMRQSPTRRRHPRRRRASRSARQTWVRTMCRATFRRAQAERRGVGRAGDDCRRLRRLDARGDSRCERGLAKAGPDELHGQRVGGGRRRERQRRWLGAGLAARRFHGRGQPCCDDRGDGQHAAGAVSARTLARGADLPLGVPDGMYGVLLVPAPQRLSSPRESS